LITFQAERAYATYGQTDGQTGNSTCGNNARMRGRRAP